MGLAMPNAHLGNERIALDCLERVYDERVGWMPLMAREPALDILRPSRRFQRLLHRIGPPEASPSAVASRVGIDHSARHRLSAT
jgi:hypothetical protein